MTSLEDILVHNRIIDGDDDDFSSLAKNAWEHIRQSINRLRVPSLEHRLKTRHSYDYIGFSDQVTGIMFPSPFSSPWLRNIYVAHVICDADLFFFFLITRPDAGKNSSAESDSWPLGQGHPKVCWLAEDCSSSVQWWG